MYEKKLHGTLDYDLLRSTNYLVEKTYLLAANIYFSIKDRALNLSIKSILTLIPMGGN